MEEQRVRPAHAAPPVFPVVPHGPLKTTSSYYPASATNNDMSVREDDRAQRAASVLSGMSAEDMAAAETLNSLHTSKLHQALPVSIG